MLEDMKSSRNRETQDQVLKQFQIQTQKEKTTKEIELEKEKRLLETIADEMFIDEELTRQKKKD